VLFLNKAESKKVDFNPEPLNLVDFLTELVDELKSPLDNKYNLFFENIGDCNQCYIDVKLLRQIITNLLSNAFKYCPNGGTVSLHLNCEQTRVIFQIADEGIGIPDEDKQKLFEVGVGTTFTVNLPQHREEETGTQGRKETEIGKRREIFGEQSPASDTLQLFPSSFEEN
jgi:signal transduction histidine kinase